MNKKENARTRLLVTVVTGILAAGWAVAGDHSGHREDDQKDPAKAVKKIEDAGVTVANVQTTCPVMGGKINKASYVDHDGKRIYLCCAGCAGALKADPAKYIKKLESEGIVLDPADKGGEKEKKK